ncbi:MAG: AtpZ/AtpI family protein, partial [Myxococcales bacterium]|nr:AtpZ/AtpI family protein [Myxococcales bacterium]
MKRRPAGSRWARASAVGIEVAIAIVGCLLIGGWLDEKLGTDPWLALVGILLGSGVAIRAVIVAARDVGEPDDPL